MVQFLMKEFGHLLRFGGLLLTPELLILYRDKIEAKSGVSTIVIGFIDGTVRGICRPIKYQRSCYNGHKRKHALKFQSVTLPNGLILQMFGPMEGKCQTSGTVISILFWSLI